MIESLQIFDSLKEHTFTETQAKGIIDALARQEYNQARKLSSSAEFTTLYNTLNEVKIHLKFLEKLMYCGFGIMFASLSYLVFGK